MCAHLILSVQWVAPIWQGRTDPVCIDDWDWNDDAISAILVMRVYIWQLMKYISLSDYFYFLLLVV
jgi:hypothetical protein